jgi:nicotinate-nucleotide adenylyltransferase
MTRRIGVFGGTFDPIHIGHLILAERAREGLALDRVLFLPASAPPHKRNRPVSDAKLRREMVDVAIGGNEAFESSDLEIRRGGVSYTVDTLREIRRLQPADELFLLLGGDAVDDVPNWKDPDEIVRLAVLAVARRSCAERPLALPYPDARVAAVDMPTVDVSSSEIRRLVQAGRSIRYLVPAGVQAFIDAHNLYRGEL